MTKREKPLKGRIWQGVAARAMSKRYGRLRWPPYPEKRNVQFYMVTDQLTWHLWWIRFGPGYSHSRLKCRLVNVGYMIWVIPGDDPTWQRPAILIYYLDGPAKSW